LSNSTRLRSIAPWLGIAALTAVPLRELLANHGPGTSGGGSSTASGETLKAGAFDLSLRFDETEFEDLSRQDAAQRATKSGDFDALRRSLVTTMSLAYGVTEDFQVGASLGYYRGSDFFSAEQDAFGTVDVADADPHGLTDLWLQGKYRFVHNELGSLALIGGVKLPTGNDDQRLSNGEKLEPSSQPGTGAFDGQAGLAWSRFLTPKLTADASAVYTLRGEHAGFTVGDRFDAGVALAYRLTDSITAFPNWSLFAEANVVWLGKDDDHGTLNDNSGGTTLYLTPGARVRFDPHSALTLAPSFPVVQSLHGEQIETRFKVAATLSFGF
jgi:hypothetical protein